MDYLYDSSFEGLLSAIFYAYPNAHIARIYKKEMYAYNLLSEPIDIATDETKADRVYNSIKNKLSSHTLKNVYHLYLSDLPDIETLILKYLKLCYNYGDQINLAKHNEIIANVDKYAKRVTLEAHRFFGFVRFKEVSPMLFYAPIEPTHNILPLIMNHFAKRFSDQNFIIHDLNRNTAIIYNKKETLLAYLNSEEVKTLKKLDFLDAFEDLFKSYYTSTTINERINLRRRSRYMPKRYFKHLVEL